MARERVGVYPGTFDPIHNGHLDVIRRATLLVDRLIVAVAINAGKEPLFALEERTAMVEHDVAALAAANGIELLGGPGELGCSLLIEIADAAERDAKLRAWKALPGHLYARLADGRRVRATFDARQVGQDRLSSVQYVKFAVGGDAPVALGCDLPGAEAEAQLTPDQRAALARDLAS
jgi:cytidyltransferase-like protein